MRKLSQGEPVKIAADDYNRWQEAGRAHAMSRLNQSQQIVTPDAQEGIVLVKNTLSRAMPRFSVLGLRGSTYNPLYSDQQLTEFKNQIALHGETPSSVTSGRFCVLQNDAQPGEVVAGMVSGVTPCRIKVESLTDEFAEIETTTTVDQTRYLKSGSSGSAQILFRPEYTGEQWGVVRLGNRTGTTFSDTASGLTNGTWTGATGVYQYSGVSSFSPFDGDDTFELDTDGYVVINRNPVPCFVQCLLYVFMPFSRNNWSRLECSLQLYYSGSWSNMGFPAWQTTAWPDLGTLSGSGQYDYYTLFLRSGYSFSVGTKIRLAFKPEFSGTLPADINVAGCSLNFFHQ